MTFCYRRSAFLDFEVLYLRVYCLERISFFENLHDNFAFDYVLNFGRLQIFKDELNKIDWKRRKF